MKKMTKQEAEKILELNGKYEKIDIKRNYKKLLHKYHPDTKSHLSETEKKEKTECIIEAYKFLCTKQAKVSIDELKEFLSEIKDAEEKEYQLAEITLDKIPDELKSIIMYHYQNFKILTKTTILKSYNLETKNYIENTKHYEQEYYKMRVDLTYTFFNYLEKNVQKSLYSSCGMYAQNSKEYIKEGTPEILESLYEIVIKFLNYFEQYLKEKERIQKEMQTNMILEIKEIRNNCGELTEEISKECDRLLENAIEFIKQNYQPNPNQLINTFSALEFIKKFDKNLKDIIESYAIFLENETLVKSLALDEVGSIEEKNSLLDIRELLNRKRNDKTYERRLEITKENK